MAGYKYLGKRIYYLKIDGRVILDTGEAEGWVVENPHELQDPPLTKKEYDFKIYAELQKYNPEEVDYIELKWGEFKTEFAECTSYRVNIETKTLEFDYTPVPEPPEVPTSPTLHERMETQENRNNEQDDIMFEQSYKIAMLELNTASLSSLE